MQRKKKGIENLPRLIFAESERVSSWAPSAMSSSDSLVRETPLYANWARNKFLDSKQYESSIVITPWFVLNARLASSLPLPVTLVEHWCGSSYLQNHRWSDVLSMASARSSMQRCRNYNTSKEPNFSRTVDHAFARKVRKARMRYQRQRAILLRVARVAGLSIDI